MDIEPPPIASAQSKIEKKSDGFWHCTQCPERFRLLPLLWRHMRLNGHGPYVECPSCGIIYPQQYLPNHVLIHKDMDLNV